MYPSNLRQATLSEMFCFLACEEARAGLQYAAYSTQCDNINGQWKSLARLSEATQGSTPTLYAQPAEQRAHVHDRAVC